MERVTIKKCGRLFKFQCPKTWDELEQTSLPEMRFCSSCSKNVFLCRTVEDMKASKGVCVALIVDENGKPTSRKQEEKALKKELEKYTWLGEGF